ILAKPTVHRVAPSGDVVETVATGPDRHAARGRAWRLLGKLFVDQHESVSARAKASAIAELGGAVRSELGERALAALISNVVAFSAEERMQLWESLAAVRAYASSWLGSCATELEELERLVAPSTF